MDLGLIGYFDVALYAWSAHFIDVSITAILYETSPILLILLAGWLFRSERRYRKISPLALILFIVAFLGVASIIASQSGGFGNLRGASPLGLGSGVFLVLVAASAGALAAFGLKWGVDMAAALPTRGSYGKHNLELFGTIVGGVVCSLSRIHRGTALGTALEEGRGCSCESGIMVLKQKTARKQGAPNRRYHATIPIASASSLTTTAWWPMPDCCSR